MAVPGVAPRYIRTNGGTRRPRPAKDPAHRCQSLVARFAAPGSGTIDAGAVAIRVAGRGSRARLPPHLRHDVRDCRHAPPDPSLFLTGRVLGAPRSSPLQTAAVFPSLLGGNLSLPAPAESLGRVAAADALLPQHERGTRRYRRGRPRYRASRPGNWFQNPMDGEPLAEAGQPHPRGREEHVDA